MTQDLIGKLIATDFTVFASSFAFGALIMIVANGSRVTERVEKALDILFVLFCSICAIAFFLLPVLFLISIWS